MLVLRDPAVGIHDGTSITLCGIPSRDESCEDPVGPLGSGCYRGRERPPRAAEVASSLLEK